MHELGIIENIINITSEHAKGRKIQRILLEIGQLSGIMSDAIRFGFDVCSQGTLLEGAILEITETPGLGKCRQCGQEIALEQPFGVCHCGSMELDLIAGQELKIKEMEVESCV